MKRTATHTTRRSLRLALARESRRPVPADCSRDRPHLEQVTLGVIGVSQGQGDMRNFLGITMRVTAICDVNGNIESARA
jgi:hypothetical protein